MTIQEIEILPKLKGFNSLCLTRGSEVDTMIRTYVPSFIDSVSW